MIDNASETANQTPVWPPLPTWMMDVPIRRPQSAASATQVPPSAPVRQQPPPPPPPSQQASPPQTASANESAPTAADLCPEIVWRQIRWPASEQGTSVQMPCPSHARSGNPSEPFPASLACLPAAPASATQRAGAAPTAAAAQWASRVHAPRCQSDWLRELSQRLERGDSPVAALVELAQRTRPTPSQLALFGDDLVQIGRLTRRLVDDMADHLQRIQSDKQRVSFARQIVQVSQPPFVCLFACLFAVANAVAVAQHTKGCQPPPPPSPPAMTHTASSDWARAHKCRRCNGGAF